MLEKKGYTFTCTAGYFPECCGEFIAGLGEEPTGTGLQCVNADEEGGCVVGQTPTCCSDLVGGALIRSLVALPYSLGLDLTVFMCIGSE